VRRNIGLVYGGGNVGLMGVLADAVLQAGGEAVGGIPESLMAREVGQRLGMGLNQQGGAGIETRKL
jgi:predicted Rossmann-fold nucleotide-binding protein